MSNSELLVNTQKPWANLVANSLKLTGGSTTLANSVSLSAGPGTIPRNYIFPPSDPGPYIVVSPTPAPPSGPITSIANDNIDGIGVYHQQIGSTAYMRGVNAASSKVSVGLDVGDDTIDIDIVPANISIQSLGNGGGAVGDILQNNGTNFIDSANIKDSASVASIDYSARHLLASDGITVGVDYSSAAGTKVNNVAITGTPSAGQIPIAVSASSATWQTQPSSIPGGAAGDILQSNGVNFVDSTTLKDSAGVVSLDYKNRLLKDNAAITSIDYLNRSLRDAGGVINSIDYGARLLTDSGSIQSIDYQNRVLKDQNPFPSVDYKNRILYDFTGTGVSLNYTGRILVNSSAVTLLDYSVAKLKLGSASLQWPNADGSAGQVLTTNGASVLSFTNAIGTMASAQYLYVSKNGNDTTGNGSWQFPYLTITKAVTQVLALVPSPTVRYSIIIGAGTYSDNIAIPANCSIVGDNEISVLLSGNYSLDATGTWTGAGDNRSSFENVRFTGSMSFDFTAAGVASTAGKLYFYSCRLSASGVTLVGNGAITQAEVQGCHAFGAITSSLGSLNSIGSEFDGTITINDSALNNAGATFQACTLAALSATVAFGGVSVTLASSSMSGTLTTTGAVALTVSLLPTTQALSATTTITYLSGPSTFNETWSGPYAVAQTGNLSLLLQNNRVSMRIPAFSAATTGSAVISAVTVLPPQYRPSQKQVLPVIVISGGTTLMGSIVIDTSGAMTISNNVFTSAFPISVSVSGIGTATTVTYLLS